MNNTSNNHDEAAMPSKKIVHRPKFNGNKNYNNTNKLIISRVTTNRVASNIHVDSLKVLIEKQNV